jgi:hypothetical protein
MRNVGHEPLHIASQSGSDDCRGWNDGIQRPDDINFQITEVFQSGRNPYQIPAWPRPNQGARVAQANRNRAQLERVEKRPCGIAASRQCKRDHTAEEMLASVELRRGQGMSWIGAVTRIVDFCNRGVYC